MWRAHQSCSGGLGQTSKQVFKKERTRRGGEGKEGRGERERKEGEEKEGGRGKGRRERCFIFCLFLFILFDLSTGELIKSRVG